MDNLLVDSSTLLATGLPINSPTLLHASIHGPDRHLNEGLAPGRDGLPLEELPIGGRVSTRCVPWLIATDKVIIPRVHELLVSPQGLS